MPTIYKARSHLNVSKYTKLLKPWPTFLACHHWPWPTQGRFKWTPPHCTMKEYEYWKEVWVLLTDSFISVSRSLVVKKTKDQHKTTPLTQLYICNLFMSLNCSIVLFWFFVFNHWVLKYSFHSFSLKEKMIN